MAGNDTQLGNYVYGLMKVTRETALKLNGNGQQLKFRLAVEEIITEVVTTMITQRLNQTTSNISYEDGELTLFE